MTIEMELKFEGNFRRMERRFPGISASKILSSIGGWSDWIGEKNCKLVSRKFVIFIGKTGHGKSSTINALHGGDILEESEVKACTRSCSSLDYRLEPGKSFCLGDLPGIGETVVRDKEYLTMYRDFIESAACVVYVIKADHRDDAVDEAAAKLLFGSRAAKRKVLFAVSQCDKIEPISRSEDRTLTAKQRASLDRRIAVLNKKFEAYNEIVPYSSKASWNVDVLAREVFRVCVD